MRILVSAYACEPGLGSEPGVGWNLVKQVARNHQVWVITRANNRPTIEAGLEREPLPTARWIYFDLPYWSRFWKRGRRGIYLYYCLWQIGAYVTAKRLHGVQKFDIVHHATFANYWLPTLMWLLPVPFVWGPVGGGESAPYPFLQGLSGRAIVYEILRCFGRWIGERNPAVRLCARRARVTFASTDETAAKLRRLGARQVETLSQAALPPEEVSRLAALPRRNAGPFRLLSIGTLIGCKGFHLALAAFARFQESLPASEYWLIGDGPERRRLERLAQRLRVSTRVRFWGNLPRTKVLKLLGECDVLVHPTLHDSGGWVCVEAMAAGRPVVCLNLGGPGLLVGDEAGFRIHASTAGRAVYELADRILVLARDSGLRGRLGEEARRRAAEHHEWSGKGNKISLVYETLASSEGRPSVPFANQRLPST